MSGLYANTGVDLDLILYTGSGAQTTEIYDDTGLDIGLKYSSGDTGYALGFQVHDGRDVGRILGGEVAEIWRTEQTKRSRDRSAVESAGWELVNAFKKDKFQWKKVTSTTDSRTIGIHHCLAPHPYYGAYAFHVAANATDSEVEVSLGGVSGGSGGGIWLSEIRSPNTYTKNFLVVGLGSELETKEDYVNEDGSVVKQYVPVYQRVRLRITLKASGIPTRSYVMNLSF